MGDAEGYETEYTDIQDQFLELLKKYPVKHPETVVDYVSSQGETVLEDPARLATALSECEISPVRRRQILKHWFADKGVEVPPSLLQKVALPPELRQKGEEEEAERKEREKAKYAVDLETGAIRVASTTDKTALTWDEAANLSKTTKKELANKERGKPPAYVYDDETKQVRMAKQGETGGTLDQAKELKGMAEKGKGEEAESPFMQDEAGNWILNPKAKVTVSEVLALEAIRRAQQKGEPVDPLEELAKTASKMKIYQEALGGGRGMPEWMTDPAKFIEIVRTIGGEGRSETVEKELASLRGALEDMKEEKFMGLISSQQHQIQALLDELKKMGDRIADLGKPATGRTEMDIIHEVATEGLGLAKTELSGLRKDIRDMVGSSALPPHKSSEAREERKQGFKAVLKNDKEIEALGQHLFFNES